MKYVAKTMGPSGHTEQEVDRAGLMQLVTERLESGPYNTHVKNDKGSGTVLVAPQVQDVMNAVDEAGTTAQEVSVLFFAPVAGG